MTKNRLKILLVERADSDSTVYNLLAEIKEFDLERVSNHKAVLQAIGHKEHNVYIIDDELDKQDGLAVLREAIAQGCNTPLIMLMTAAKSGVELNFLRAGAADCLIKERLDRQTLKRSILYAVERGQTMVAWCKRANELEVVARVNAAISTILDSETLLQRVVDLTREGFGLKYVHIGLLNETGDVIEMAAGAGEVGRQIMAAQPYIPVNQEQSLVARAVRSRQGIVVNNVDEDPGFFRHPLLPFTRSEMVVPMIVGERLIGVLDLQSDQLGYFDDENLLAYTILATQVGVALENARRFEQEHKLAVELQEARNFLDSIVEHIPNPLFVKEAAELKYIRWNRANEALVGLDRQQFLGKSDFDLFPKEQAEFFTGKDREILSSGQPLDVPEQAIRGADGSTRTVHTIKVPIFDAEGNPKYLLGISEDITERKQMQEELQKTRAELEQRVAQRTAELQNANNQLMTLYQVGQAITAPLQLDVVLDVIALNTAKMLGTDTGVILLLDEATQTLTIEGAYGLGESVVKNTRDKVGESIAGRVVQTGKPIIANDLPNDPRFYNPSTEGQGLLACASVPLTVGRKIIGTLDVHSRVERHAFNEEHIQMLKLLASQAAIAIDNAQLYERLQAAHRNLEMRIQERTAELVTVNEQLHREIAERRQTEEALRESEERYRVTFEQAPVGIVQMGLNRKWLWVNQKLCQILGYSAQELQGISSDDITYVEDLKLNSDYIRHMLAGEIDMHSREKRCVCKDGSIIWINRTISTVCNQSGEPGYFVAIVEDITRRKVLEQRLEDLLEQRSRQMQTSTEVAQGIAAAPALDELFQRVVHLVQERFGYYHAHVYTLEKNSTKEENIFLVMQEGTGQAGRMMKKAGHKIPLVTEKSLVARAARTRQPVLVSDVSQEPDWLPNDLLPETKSEIAVPISLGNEVLGVLDVQHNSVGGLTEEDQLLLLGLCGQIAVAIDYRRTEAERQQAEAALDRRAREMTALYQTALEINAELDISILLQRIVHRAAELSGTEMGSLALTKAEDNSLLEVAAVHNRPDSDLGLLVKMGQGATGRIAQTGEAMIITNYHHWPGRTAHFADEPVGRILGVPLKQGNQVIGVLNVFDEKVGQFEENEVQLLNLFATYTAVVIQKARLFEAEQRQREIAEALSDLARVVNSSLELNEVLGRTLLQLEDAIPYDSALISSIEGEHARMVASRNFAEQEELLNKALPLSMLPLSAKVIHQQLPLLVPDTHQESLFKPVIHGSLYARCLILVPLVIRNQAIAVLTVINYTPQRYSEEDVDIVFRFGQQVVIAIENARLYEQVKRYNVELEQRVAERTAELEATQEALIRQEKLAVLGQLAGSVAHELLNPLGVVTNAVYFLQLTLDNANETTQEYLKIISDWVYEAEKIVSGLIAFSHIRPAEREEVAVSDLVAGVLEMYPPAETVQVITHLHSNLPAVFVDPKQIGQQVLANLITNAYHAMPNGGQLTLNAQVEQNYVSLFITDTGSGMSSETTQKIFEPLFSTKTHGIGLGLALSKNLVEVNSGSIHVESGEGIGTTFKVSLPIKENVK